MTLFPSKQPSAQAICPQKLVARETYLAQSAIRDLLWPLIGRDGQDWADDSWDGLILPSAAR